MKKVLLLTIVIIFLFTGTVFADNSLENGLKAILLGEYESGEVLYNYNIDTSVEIASITKLMTYLVTMDELSKGKGSLDDIVVIGPNPPKESGTSLRLKEGEQIKLEDLISSILIVSANDSCVAIAEHLAGSEEKFVELMNKKAEEIGLENTRYLNANGLPEKEGQNMMSASDIFKLARYILGEYPDILKITKRMELSMDERGFRKENTNPLLKETINIDGLKTGYTDKAGYCLVSTLEVSKTEENQEPFRLISIAMGAKTEEERANKSREILEYGIINYSKEKILSEENYVEKTRIENAKIPEVEIFPSKDLYILMKKGNEIEKEIILNDNLIAPLKSGDIVGKIMVHNGDKKEEVDLIIKRDVEKANIFMRIYRYIAAWVAMW